MAGIRNGTSARLYPRTVLRDPRVQGQEVRATPAATMPFLVRLSRIG